MNKLSTASQWGALSNLETNPFLIFDRKTEKLLSTAMSHTTHSAALPRSMPSAGFAAGFAAYVRPFAVGEKSIGNLGFIASLGHESSDDGHNAQWKQGVIRGGLSM